MCHCHCHCQLVWRRNWRTEFIKKVTQQLVKKLKNYEELLRGDKSSQTVESWWINCLCNKRGASRLWVSCCLKFGICRTTRILFLMKGIFTILRQRAALEHPTFLLNPWLFWVPEVCIAAILGSSLIHGILWVLMETVFLKVYLLKKYHPPSSSKIQGTRHLLLADWDLKLQELPRHRWEKRNESHRIRRHMYHASKKELEFFQNILVQLIHTMVWSITKDFHLGNASWKIPRLNGFPML